MKINMIKINFKKIKEQKGFTLLFAVLVSIMVLAVGTSIINISLKQVILSSAGRESQFAFYAANTGMECALYWDYNGAIVNDDGTASYVFPPPGGEARSDLTEIRCASSDITDGSQDNWDFTSNLVQTVTNQLSTTVFQIEVSNDLPGMENVLYCAQVTVVKSPLNNDEGSGGGSVLTTITSQGLNTCEPDTDARAVERGLVLEYES